MRRSIAVVTAVLALAACAAAEGEAACPECGEPGSPGAKYCMKCGAELVSQEELQVKFCPYCGAENVPDAVYCNKCARRFPEAREKYALCPHCGEAVGAEDTTCPRCGETIAGPEITYARGTWPRSRFAASLDFSGWFGDRGAGSWGGEMAVFFSEHFCAGFKIGRVFHADGSGRLFGASTRAYFLPYSRGFFLKPYAKGEFGSERIEWIHPPPIGISIRDGFYFRLCGGLDFRILRSFVVPYFEAGLHYWDWRGDKYPVVCGGLRAVF
jgi:predicted RNA-binding Zn-ribbon protein involved in translation (DUF1610 family)